ncbi:Histone [Desulfarculales bacterium]
MKLPKHAARAGLACFCALALGAVPLCGAVAEELVEPAGQPANETPFYQKMPKPKPVKIFSDEAPQALAKGKKSKRANAQPARSGKSRQGKKALRFAAPAKTKSTAVLPKAAKASKDKKGSKASQSLNRPKAGFGKGPKPKALKPKKSGVTNQKSKQNSGGD